MLGWKSKIEAAAAAGRRSSFEVLNRIWNDTSNYNLQPTNEQVSRPHSAIPAVGTSSQSTLPRNLNHFCGNTTVGSALSVKRQRDTSAVVFAVPANQQQQFQGEVDVRMSANIVLESGTPMEVVMNPNGITSDHNNEHLNNVEGDYCVGCQGRHNEGEFNNAKSELNALLEQRNLNERSGNNNVRIVPMSRPLDGGGGGGSGRPSQGEMDRGNVKLWKSHGNHSMGLVLSALYAKLLVVMGIAFPLSEVMSTYIPAAYYDGFYMYLYFGSILFMMWVFGYIIRERARISARVIVKGMSNFALRSKTEAIEPPIKTSTITVNGLGITTIDPSSPSSEKTCFSSEEGDDFLSDDSSTETPQSPSTPDDLESGGGAYTHSHSRRNKGTHFGSFYLRMGCVAFGVGSMIYSGLEFGQYFELKSDIKCHNYMMALTPSVRMVFTFMQMYFIFLSSRMALFKESLSSQFGLMHMIGTNLCVWLNVLVQETKHEILSFYDPDNKTISFKSVRAHQKFSGISYTSPSSSSQAAIISSEDTNDTDMFADIFEDYSVLNPNPPEHHLQHHRVTRGLKGPYSIHECGRTNIIGSIVQDAAPFLFPCTIEYSLICAAICYVMWKSMAKRKTEAIVHKHSIRRQLSSKTYVPHHHHNGKSPHHYTVDCAASHKGLFLGIFVLVLTIMSLIINFVLSKHPDYRTMANLEAHITEIVLYTMATCAVIIGMCQVRALRYSQGRNLELDNILLIVAQTGSLIFNIFAIISGQFILKKGENLVLVTALLKVIQLLLQTLFILDASKRVATTMEQAKKKPGREVITFLLITNLAMWLINALEKSRGESHPAQLQFYGLWCWTIITHFAMPLAIFYRFHSTVCLCEIWKRAYKIKHMVR